MDQQTPINQPPPRPPTPPPQKKNQGWSRPKAKMGYFPIFDMGKGQGV